MDARHWVVVALCSVLASCASEPPSAQALLRSDLAHLVDGQTTLEQVLLSLGQPSGQFEGQRIVTFAMMLNDKRQLVVCRPIEEVGPDGRFASWPVARFSLVLVFDRQNVLEKHNLVSVW